MSRKNIKNNCVYNFKGICELNTCSHYRKRCTNVCYNFKSNTKKINNKKVRKKSNPVFGIKFVKKDSQLLLRIIVPIKYAEFCRTKRGKYNYTFKSYQKEKSIEISMSLTNAESMILFLFSDFSEKVKVNSSILYITLDDIPEITNNNTSYRKLPDKIVLTKSLKNERGNIDICLILNKKLVFSSIDELIHKDNPIDKHKSKTENSKSKNQNNNLGGRNTSLKLDESQPIISSQRKKIQPQSKKDVIITAIIISDNRKCTYNNHVIYDVLAKANVVTPNGKIILATLPAAYCDVCDRYIVLKQDFLKAKDQGVLLSSVEDKTARYIQKHANQKYKSIGESKIHKMGYNVRKDVGYTDIQRHVILANILENTNIARHEILSVIDAGIARHKSKSTHQHAIQCWISDREFITSYKTGDMPEVLIDTMVLKYH